MIKRVVRFLKEKIYSPEVLLRKSGAKIGKNCDIKTYFFGSEPYLIEIGDNVQITDGVRIFTHGGGWVFRKKYPDFDTFGKIKIGNNVYIGNCSLLMPGVVIGNNVIIGAGSVVTKNIPDNCVVAGNPARFISTIDDYLFKSLDFNINSKKMKPEDKKSLLLYGNQIKFLTKSDLKIH